MKNFNPQESLKNNFTMAIFGKTCSGKTFLIQSLLPILHKNGFSTLFVKDVISVQNILKENNEKTLIILDDLDKISFSTLCNILKSCELKQISLILTFQDIYYNHSELEFLFDFFIVFRYHLQYYPRWMRYYLDDVEIEKYKAIVIDSEKNCSFFYSANKN